MAFFLFSQEEGKGDAEQTGVSCLGGKKNPRPETKDYGESMKDGGDLLRRFSVKDKGEKRKKGSAAVQSLGRQEIEKREKEIAEEKIEGQG